MVIILKGYSGKGFWMIMMRSMNLSLSGKYRWQELKERVQRNQHASIALFQNENGHIVEAGTGH